MARGALGVLRGFALNIVRGRGLPTGYLVSFELDAVCLKQIGVGGNVPHQNIFVRIVLCRIGIASDFEIHPGRVERTPRQSFFIFADMTIGTVFVFADRMANIARNFIAVQCML